MPAPLNFGLRFSEFGHGVRPAEQAPEVLDAVEDFMLRWGYSLRNVIGAGLSVEHLGGDAGCLPDLIFRMIGFEFFEIVIRGADGSARYGGWLSGKAPVTITGETVNGWPVLLTVARDGSAVRHIYDPVSGYRPEARLTDLPLQAVRRLTAQA
ncbi:hypothetical protein ACUXV3_00235 [Roseobacteraceae bacterium NS-SX3]